MSGPTGSVETRALADSALSRLQRFADDADRRAYGTGPVDDDDVVEFETAYQLLDYVAAVRDALVTLEKKYDQLTPHAKMCVDGHDYAVGCLRHVLRLYAPAERDGESAR